MGAGARRSGLMDKVGISHSLDSVLEIFSNPNDSGRNFQSSWLFPNNSTESMLVRPPCFLYVRTPFFC